MAANLALSLRTGLAEAQQPQPPSAKVTTPAAGSPAPASTTRALKSNSRRTADVERLIKDAENLSLIQDRVQACSLLVRAQKSMNLNAGEAGRLRDKLGKLSRIFYSETSFQSYLAALALLDQNKPKEALDRLGEAAEAEHGNLDVVVAIARAQLKFKNFSAALKAVQEGRALSPHDIPLLQLKLQAQVGLEAWEDALETAVLLGVLDDKSAQTLKDRGLALFKLGRKNEAEKYLSEAADTEKEFPEPHYWLALAKEKADPKPYFEKYIAQCQKLTPEDPSKLLAMRKKFERENELCIQVDEAKRRLK